MAETTHTPGPWVSVINGDDSEFDGYRVQVRDGRFTRLDSYVLICEGIHQGPDHGRSDAQLIAAAPDLLLVAQLVTLAPLQHGTDIPAELMAAAEAAIAKATGQEGGAA